MMVPRIYDSLLAEHLASNRQMAFFSGPRQVGKTTTCRLRADAYVNWDDIDDRELILAGPRNLIGRLGLDRLSKTVPVVLFDELHKFPRWKQFLKGFFDTHADRIRIAVTGSSRMDVYRRGGDSLMGRYFPYRMHPFSIAETLTWELPDATRIVRPPRPIGVDDFDALWRHGGYPEPFLRRNARFSRRWQSLRLAQLVKEDIRDLTQIQQLDQLALMVRLLADRSAQQLVYVNLARQVRVAVDTARRWVAALCDLHLGFLVRPWFRNVSRSLRKEPKWYLRDWASIGDTGRRAETFVACHLLKAVEGWNDMGLGAFGLGYLRDKEKREVDFLVVRDGEPWFLAEVKHRDESSSPSLRRYQDQLGAPFAFQVTMDADYVDEDCFAKPGDPLISSCPDLSVSTPVVGHAASLLEAHRAKPPPTSSTTADIHIPTRGGRYVPIAILPHPNLGESHARAEEMAHAFGSGWIMRTDTGFYVADGILRGSVANFDE